MPGTAGRRQVADLDDEDDVRPVLDQDGFASDVKMYVDIESKPPAFNSKGFSLGLRRRGNHGTFVFNEDSLDNIDQGTLDMDGDE